MASSARMASALLVVMLVTVLISIQRHSGSTRNSANLLRSEPRNTRDSCFAPSPYFRPAKNRTLHLPLVNLGFPKAGTTTLTSFFECGQKFNVSHQHCLFTKRPPIRPYSDFCGKCFHKAIVEEGQSPFQFCGMYGAYMQIDMSMRECHWPQVDFLEELHRASPNATFLLTMRNFTNWYNSLSHWHSFHLRIGACKMKAYPDGVRGNITSGRQQNDVVKKALREFYCDQVSRVRTFVLRYRSHALVEVDAEDVGNGPYLSELFGINETCWVRRNANPTLHNNVSEEEAAKLPFLRPNMGKAKKGQNVARNALPNIRIHA